MVQIQLYLILLFILISQCKSQWVCDESVTECECFDKDCPLDVTYHNVSISQRNTPSLICNQPYISSISASTDCIITCNSSYSCSNTTITSIGSHTTLIDCVSTNSCSNTNINFLSSTHPSISNTNTTTNSTSLPSNNGPSTQYIAGIVCHSNASCNNATIFCDKLLCHLYCQTPLSCLVCHLSITYKIHKIT